MPENSLAQEIEQHVMGPFGDLFRSDPNLELMAESGEFGAASLDPEAVNQFTVNAVLRLAGAVIRLAQEIDRLNER